MIAALWLLACGTPTDWGGDWEGVFDASNGVEPWPIRLIDLEEVVGVDDEESTVPVGFRQWLGIFELQADDDHWVAPMRVDSCDQDTCALGDETFALHGYIMVADLNAGTFVCRGMLDGDAGVGQANRVLPGNPSLGPVTWSRADHRLRVGDPW